MLTCNKYVMPVLWRGSWSSLAVPAHLPRAHVLGSGTTAMAISIFCVEAFEPLQLQSEFYDK